MAINNKKTPAFLFYSSDFLTGTMFMTNEQVGAYIKLLCVQHQYGHLSHQQIKNIAGEHTDLILTKFVTDEKGLYYNSKLENILVDREKFCESRRQNRQKREEKKNK
jgi:hypothetical protein